MEYKVDLDVEVWSKVYFMNNNKIDTWVLENINIKVIRFQVDDWSEWPSWIFELKYITTFSILKEESSSKFKRFSTNDCFKSKEELLKSL